MCGIGSRCGVGGFGPKEWPSTAEGDGSRTTLLTLSMGSKTSRMGPVSSELITPSSMSISTARALSAPIFPVPSPSGSSRGGD
jgi:hypothetical protein